MATSAADVRATSFGQLLESAHCAITVDSGERPYQGIVEVNHDSLADSLEHYFDRSVQVPSHVALVSNEEMAGGILLQIMPGSEIKRDDWRRLGMLVKTLTPEDFPDNAGIQLIGKLFSEDDMRVFEGQPVVFRCRCSAKRAEDVLRMLGEDEIRDAIAEQGSLEVICEYCGRAREFDSVDVSRLFADNVVTGPESIQ